jgi:hypothetical protein
MKRTQILTFLVFLFAIVALSPACSKKSGCPANESLKPQTNKKGQFKKTKTQSGLFSKKMKKRMK